MASPLYRIFTITAALLSILLLVSLASPQDEAQKNLDEAYLTWSKSSFRNNLELEFDFDFDLEEVKRFSNTSEYVPN